MCSYQDHNSNRNINNVENRRIVSVFPTAAPILTLVDQKTTKTTKIRLYEENISFNLKKNLTLYRIINSAIVCSASLNASRDQFLHDFVGTSINALHTTICIGTANWSIILSTQNSIIVYQEIPTCNPSLHAAAHTRQQLSPEIHWVRNSAIAETYLQVSHPISIAHKNDGNAKYELTWPWKQCWSRAFLPKPNYFNSTMGIWDNTFKSSIHRSVNVRPMQISVLVR